MNKELLRKITLGFLSIFYLGLGITSVFHCIEFWKISNTDVFAIILSIGAAFGIASSLLLVLFPKHFELEKSRYVILILTVIIEFLGNVFYLYVHIHPEGILYNDLLGLLSPILNNYELMDNFDTILRSYMALFLGLWIPLTHIAVFTAILKLSEGTFESITEETKVESITEETKVESIIEETKVESITEDTKVESITEDTEVEPIKKQFFNPKKKVKEN